MWQGLITNDTFHALRAFTRSRAPRRRIKGRQPPGDVVPFAPPRAAVCRGTLDAGANRGSGSATRSSRRNQWAAAVTQQLLARHGVVTREAVAADGVAGGFGIVYPVLKGLEENGRIRRGYFVAGLGRDAVRDAWRARPAALAARRAG